MRPETLPGCNKLPEMTFIQQKKKSVTTCGSTYFFTFFRATRVNLEVAYELQKTFRYFSSKFHIKVKTTNSISRSEYK